MTQYVGADAFPEDFTIPDDAAPPTAAELLVSIEALGDRTRWTKNRLAQIGQGLNWRDFVIPSGTIGGNPREHWGEGAWDALNQRWLLSVITAASVEMEVQETYDNGKNWFTRGDSLHLAGNLLGVMADPVDPNVTLFSLYASGTTSARIYRQDLGSSTAWVNKLAVVLAGATKAGELRFFNSLYIAVFSGAKAYSSVDGSTWTNRAIPATGGLDTAADWAVAQSPTTMIAVQRVANKPVFMYTTDGTTWTNRTLGASIIATETPVAIAYGDTTSVGVPAFIVAIYDSATTSTRFMQSIDEGASWTSVVIGGSFAAIKGRVTDLRAFGQPLGAGPLWVAATESASAAGFALVSFNGCKDWAQTSATLTDNVAVGGTNYQRPRVWVGPRGMMLSNALETRTTPEYGPTTPATLLYA